MSTKGFEETIEYDKTMKVVEEYLNVDSSLMEMENNKDLIRLEMNIVEFPIFSKSNNIKTNQVKKYYFSADKESYLEIIPAFDTMIPGELEERVFIALTKILRNNGYSQTFYCTINDIFDNMKIENKMTRKGLYPKVKKAISRMASTTFRFKNLFYSNEVGRVMDNLTETHILSYNLISLKDASSSESNFFSDKRIKEIYKITISDHFHENIIKKGYLAFDADELLNIKDSVTRSIYTMISKWRFNNLYLKKTAFHIARRIPLSWDNNSRRTVQKIEKSLHELKEYGYIKDFNFNKNGKWERSEFEIFFDVSHNKIKREIFYDEKANFDKMIMHIEDRQNEVDINTPSLFNEPQFIEIINIFPEVAKRFKTLPNVIREALKNHDYQYVKYTAEYTSLFCKASFIKYFKDAIDQRWADEYIAKKIAKEEKKIKISKTIIEEAVIVEDPKEIKISKTWDEYLSLSQPLQDEISAAAYEDFLMQSESSDNKIARGIFEKSKKSFILKIMVDYENVEKEPKQEELKQKENKKAENTKNSSIKTNEIKTEIIEETSSNGVISGIYPTVTNFLLVALTYIQEQSLDINPKAFMTLFDFMKNYEDNLVKITYDETTKIGEIVRKS